MGTVIQLPLPVIAEKIADGWPQSQWQIRSRYVKPLDLGKDNACWTAFCRNLSSLIYGEVSREEATDDANAGDFIGLRVGTPQEEIEHLWFYREKMKVYTIKNPKGAYQFEQATLKGGKHLYGYSSETGEAYCFQWNGDSLNDRKQELQVACEKHKIDVLLGGMFPVYMKTPKGIVTVQYIDYGRRPGVKRRL